MEYQNNVKECFPGIISQTETVIMELDVLCFKNLLAKKLSLAIIDVLIDWTNHFT